MNIHKLMANVLLECELYLGLALLFPSPAVNKDARQNLDGCLAKRKFRWSMDCMEQLFSVSLHAQ